MNEQAKPSAAALRAAKELDTEGFVFSWKTNQAAEIIDRETGLAELLEASKEVAGTRIGLGSALERLEQAIAKAEAK